MSAHLSILTAAPAGSKERAHRSRLLAGVAVAATLLVALAVYGFDYYTMATVARPYSPKHALLRSSGTIGIKLGMLGVLLFAAIYLYPLRKRISWLRRGSAKHWLDFHVLFGVSAPLIIAFHASFKFRGVAGMAFWIMSAVALSGIIGRYIYGQIPRTLNAAELSYKKSLEIQEQLAAELAGQEILSRSELETLFRLPSPQRVSKLPALAVLATMLKVDLLRVFQVAALRRVGSSRTGTTAWLWGFVPSSSREVERVVAVARRQASLSKRIMFLSRTQQVFHLWHVIHRPFSYSFAVLAAIHILVVIGFGFI